MNMSKQTSPWRNEVLAGEKTVGAFEARRNFGKVLKGVEANKSKYIIEKNGEPVAALVPVNLYEQWKQSRETLVNKISRIQNIANLTPEVAEDLAKEAVKFVRSQKIR